MTPRALQDLGFLGTANSVPFVPPIPVWLCATSPTDLNVVLGTNNLHSPSLEVKGVTSIVLHKDFKILNMESDIALLLDSPITSAA